MVDIMFHEDSGLLNCSRNDEAIAKAGRYLKKYAQPSIVSINEQTSLIISVMISVKRHFPTKSVFQFCKNDVAYFLHHRTFLF